MIARTLFAASLLFPIAGSAVESDPATLIREGHFKRARPILEARLTANSRDAAALVLMAKVRLAYQDLDAATRLSEQAATADPKNSEAHVVLADCVSRRTNDAGMFEKIRLAGQIKSELEQALTLDPRNIEAMEGMIQFSMQAPGIAGGSRSRALELADRIMALDPVRGNLAMVLIADDDRKFDQFEGLYLKALALSPRSYEANARLAGLYASERLKKYDKAIQYAQACLQIDPARVSGYTTLAFVYASRQQWQDLDQVLARAEKEVPDCLTPHYTAGRIVLLSNKDLARAEGLFRKYLTQEPEGNAPPLAGAHWRLGQILDKEGRRQEALRELQIAVSMKGLGKQNLEEAQADLKRLKG